MNDTTASDCTCPSGDGSLRHPCPTHSIQRTQAKPAAAQEAVAWGKTKPTAEGAYYVRGFNLFQLAQYEALVQVRTHHFDGEPAPELVCNIHESTSNADMEDWSPIVEMSEDFEWLGPLVAAPVAAAPVDGDFDGTSYKRMFIDACEALAEVSRELDCDPEEGGAEPILAAIAKLKASTPAAPGIDPADPWRGLYAPELMPKLDGVDAYHVAHPDLPSWPKDEDEERGVSPLVKAQGFELEAVFGEYPEDDDEDPDYCAWLAQWQPTPPTGEHWRLVCIQDTEDGPAAFYVRPFALIDASPKGGNDEANIPAPHRECYSDDGGDSWYEHPADAELVYGLKVGDTYTLIVSHCSVERTYRVTKAPDEASDDYEVEPVQATGAEVGA